VNLELLRDEIATILADELDASPAILPECLDGLPQLLQSDRARAVRRIAEIANVRGWQIEVVRVLDQHHAAYVDDLPESAVFALRDRMEYFEECVQCACDPDDAPPAR
jgi:hypothetical protein